jgi:hypothetical protein
LTLPLVLGMAIAATLENRLLSESHVRRRYLCSPHHQDTLQHPVLGQLTRAAGFERRDDAASLRNPPRSAARSARVLRSCDSSKG